MYQIVLGRFLQAPWTDFDPSFCTNIIKSVHELRKIFEKRTCKKSIPGAKTIFIFSIVSVRIHARLFVNSRRTEKNILYRFHGSKLYLVLLLPPGFRIYMYLTTSRLYCVGTQRAIASGCKGLKLSRQLLTAPKPKLRIVVQKVLFFGSHRFPEGFLLIGTGIRCFGTINVVVSWL